MCSTTPMRQTHIIMLVNKFGVSIGECANITGQSGGALAASRMDAP
jgi:hypothetical protein